MLPLASKNSSFALLKIKEDIKFARSTLISDFLYNYLSFLMFFVGDKSILKVIGLLYLINGIDS